MKIVKPLSLGLLQRCYTQGGAHRMVVAALGFFPLGAPAPARLLGEAQQWGRLSGALPPGQPLDEVMPKACGEALVFGAAWGGHGARLQVGRIDKQVEAGPGPGPHPLQALAPIPIDSPERKRYAGTYDERWRREAWPGLPRDLDWRLYNQGPENQRLAGWFSGGERYRLEGMRADGAVIEGVLPPHRVRAFALQQELSELALVLDTVWFFPALALGVAAWRGTLPVTDSDGLDVQALLAAYEDHAAAARPFLHYADSLRLRTERKTAALHALNESQLAPRLPETPPTLAQQIAAGDADLTPMMDEVAQLRTRAEAHAQAQRALLPAPPLHTPPSPTWVQVRARALLDVPELAGLRRAAPTPVGAAQPLAPDVAWQLGQMLQDRVAAGLPVAGRDFAGADLRGAKLAGADLSLCLLEYANLDGADLRAARLAGAALTRASFSRANLDDADLAEANLCGTNAQSPSMVRAKLAGARAFDAGWPGADARGANLSRAVLQRVDLSGAQLDGARLEGTLVAESQLADSSWREVQALRFIAWDVKAPRADFSHSSWRRSALPGSDLSGSRWRGARLVQLQGMGADWSGADLAGARAERCAWTGATMRAVRLEGAFLGNCELSRADLTQATLDGGCFAHSLFMQAGLAGASARGADFFQALLRKADCRDADLRGASAYQADLTGLQWHGARTDDLVLHTGAGLP